MKELTLKATVENIVPVTAFVESTLEEVGCPMKAQMQINVALDELFGNIARYAYTPEVGDVTVQVDFDEAERIVSITLIDSGSPFNPLLTKEPDVTMSAEERQIGGLGIFLVRKTMDALEYHFQDGHNILTFRKRI